MNFLLIVLIPFVFIAFWAFIVSILAQFGWSTLARDYKTSPEFYGTDYGIVSARINLVNYKASLILKYNDEGIFLRPSILFRISHPPVFVPWNEISAVDEGQFLFAKYVKIGVGSPVVANIFLSKRTFDQLRGTFQKYGELV